jgi:CRP/FNR family transcriptional regulator
VVEDVAFERIDKRLAQKLLDLADSEGRLSATHPEPAVELGSAREVVSRHLKEFQRRGWLELTRGLICLTDRASLERLAAGNCGAAPERRRRKRRRRQRQRCR